MHHLVQIHYREVLFMTKYREIIRLTSLGFSQRNIMASCGVAQKTVVKVQKRARELNLAWPLDETITDIELQKLLFKRKIKCLPTKECPILRIFAKNYSVMESVKSFYGPNTWKTAVLMVKNHLCILNSAITFNRTSRNIVQPCTSTESPVNRLK